ncbi:MAG: hypothetical protein SR3Q1_02405 [Quinella sp. 3Q1]|nr:hypothetical protein [Quinella sp. 3Q1]MBR6887664.1 hypothetical protein [Selenomonadaceae bacterium]
MAEREIKYRGLKTFQIFSGEKKSVWIYGFYLKRGTYGDPGPQAHIFVYENGYEGYRVDSKTIGQFTGLVDSTGKEIYEDDIISLENGRIGVVNFHDGCFVVNYGSGARQALYDVQDWNMTILGNRFENPELLVSPTAPKKNEPEEQELGMPEFEPSFIARE